MNIKKEEEEKKSSYFSQPLLDTSVQSSRWKHKIRTEPRLLCNTQHTHTRTHQLIASDVLHPYFSALSITRTKRRREPR